jgi:hypothetical protein
MNLHAAESFSSKISWVWVVKNTPQKIRKKLKLKKKRKCKDRILSLKQYAPLDKHNL